MINGGYSSVKKISCGPRPTLSDYVSLWFTFLAKLGRRRLDNAAEPHCTNEFYEDFFQKKDVQGAEQDERRIIRRETIREYLKKHLPEEVYILDVGCGFGELLSGLPTCYHRSGVDFSDSNVRVANRLLNGKAIVKQGSIYKIPFDTASQDVCLCLEVLEHIEDDSRGVRELWRVLKPGGLLIASVPYTFYWPEYKKLIGHYRHYTRGSLANLLKKNCFVIVDYLPNYPNWHFTYSRLYTYVRFLSLIFGRFTGTKDVFTFTWPWSTESMMEKMSRKLYPLLQQDRNINYANADFGTFVVAKKEIF